MKKLTLLVLLLGHFAFAQYTPIPDLNFEQALIDLGYDNILDGQVLTDNIDEVGSLDVNNKSIHSLEGIEDFNNLQVLTFHNNSLSSLDISNNNLLYFLGGSNNQLTEINLSNNSLLESIDLRNNPLNTLDVTNNLELTNLAIWAAPLTFLDLTNNINLIGLVCNETGISYLDLSNNPLSEGAFIRDNNNLGILDLRNGNNNSMISLDATSSPSLSCVFVDDINNIPMNWIIDPTASYMEDESECDLLNQITLIPDPNFENALLDLGIDSDNTINGQVFTSDIENQISLDVADKAISDLTGIEDFTSLATLACNSNQLNSLNLTENLALEILYCGGNQLSSLDISENLGLRKLYCSHNNLSQLNTINNPLLEDLACYNNPLNSLNLSQNGNLTYLEIMDTPIKNLDVSQNPNLERLYCWNNQLSSLDLSNNSSLITVWAHQNQLTNLNVKNGTNTILTELFVQNNPNLSCIQVDDEEAANSGTGVYANWVKDANAIYSENCILDIADYNLETDLILHFQIPPINF